MKRSHKQKYTFNQNLLNSVHEKNKRYTKDSMIKKLNKSKFVYSKESNEWTIPEGIKFDDQKSRIILGLLIELGVLETDYYLENKTKGAL